MLLCGIFIFELNANSTKTYELYEYNSAIKPTQQILALEKILNIDVNKIVEKKYKLEKNNYVQLKNCNDLLHFYRNNDPKLALLFAKLLEPQLKQFSSHPSIANFTTKVANIYHDIGKYHLAIDYYSKSLYVFIDLKDYPAACNSYNDIGYIFSKLKIRDFALKNYFLGVLLRSFDGAFQISEKFKGAMDSNLDKVYYDNYFKAINTISADDLLKTANNYFKENTLSYCLAGV